MKERLRDKVIEFGNRNVQIKWIVPWVCFFAIGLGLVWSVLDAENDRALAAQVKIEAIAIHEVNDRAYEVCVSRVAARNDTRAQWISFYNALEVVFSGNPNAVRVINDVLRPELNNNLPVLSQDEQCPTQELPTSGFIPSGDD